MMYCVTKVLPLDYTPQELALMCSRIDDYCPMSAEGYMLCPFDYKRCTKITERDWENLKVEWRLPERSRPARKESLHMEQCNHTQSISISQGE